MTKTVLTCKVMVHDIEKDRVVVIDRQKSWKGITFPGGHIEEGESLVAGAIREIKEETGLTVSSLKPCGFMHWCDEDSSDRYIVFNFKTDSFSGELSSDMTEGRVFWAEVSELPNMTLAKGFAEELPMFFDGKYAEGFIMCKNDIDRETVWF